MQTFNTNNDIIKPEIQHIIMQLAGKHEKQTANYKTSTNWNTEYQSHSQEPLNNYHTLTRNTVISLELAEQQKCTALTAIINIDVQPHRNFHN